MARLSTATDHQLAPPRKRGLASVTRPGDWRLATKVAVLCVGIAGALALGMMALTYVQTTDGLQREAEAALSSDAVLVANSVDQWNEQRLLDLEALASLPAVRRVTSAGQSASPEDVRVVQELLNAHEHVRPDVNSFALIDANGLYFLSSTADVLGTRVPQRDYFQEALQGRRFVSGLTVSLTTGATVLFHSAPIRAENGTVIGVIRSRATLEGLQEVAARAESHVADGLTGVLIDASGLVITTSVDSSWILRPVVPLRPGVEQTLVNGSQWGKDRPAPPALNQLDLAQSVGAPGRRVFGWQINGSDYLAVSTPLVQTPWTYVAAEPRSRVASAINNVLRGAALVALLGIVLALALATILGRRLARTTIDVAQAASRVAEEDLPAFVRVARAVAAGDLTQQATISPRAVNVISNDEIGFLARAFNRMVLGLHETGQAFSQMTDNLREVVSKVQAAAHQSAAAAQGLSAAAARTGAATQQVNQGLNEVASGAAETSQYVNRTYSAVERLSQAIEDIGRGASQQADQVDAATRNVGELTAGVEQVATQAHTVATNSQHTKTIAENGALAVRETIAGMAEIQEVVSQATTSVHELSELGQRIGAVVKTIDDLSDQTNLLALNAAIEAARAGEHGLGFAVVAAEVRKLAERSQHETKGIAELIGRVQHGTQRAVRAMEAGARKVDQGSLSASHADTALNEILEAVENTVSQVTEIAQSAQGMAEHAHRVTHSIDTIRVVVQDNTAVAAQMASRARDVLDAVRAIAGIAEAQRAATDQVRTGGQDISAQVDEITAEAEQLALTAERLTRLVARFQVGDAESEPVQPVQMVNASVRRAA